ncbi:cache domain-containing sensor histidine kinase [Paenibacillus fonticola]|uniref:cache domain-containing sensor histidine kinase n=1 Tax=Paenibacillus fonticola TaxID=379896 RepID=UPI00035EB3A8|nr:sensor histidine kinase [Paenibacillus fonticola]
MLKQKATRFVSIKTKINVLFLLVILVPILTMFINSYISSQQLLERRYTDLMQDISRQANIRIEEFLKDVKEISLVSSYGINSYVSAVSQENYPVQNYLRDSSKANENQVAQLLMNYIIMKDRAFSIYIYNLNGGEDIYIRSYKPIDYTYYPVNEEWFQEFLHSEAITMDLSTRLDKQTQQEGNWAIFNIRKIFDMEDGKLMGVMVISLDIDFIDRLNSRLQKEIRSSFTIVDDQDRIIFNSNHDLIGQPFSASFPLDSSMSTNTERQIVTLDGRDYILIQTPFEQHEWKSYLYMPVDELAVEGNILKRNLIYIVVILVIFALISSFYLSNLITRPIKRLMKNMTLVEQGKFDNLPDVGSNDEIGLLSVRFEQMSSELKQLVERIYQEQEEKTEAEIRALQAQINPHFLYNTLNSVKWIASMQRSDKIVEMTEALISILRYASKNDDGKVSIREELEYVGHYITIQKVRYYNKIVVVYELDESLLDYPIPKLSIQPLVENAIFHGIAELEDEGTITISVQTTGESDIAIVVTDNGKGMEQEAAEELKQQLLGLKGEESIGLSNVHNRIRRVFGVGSGVSFQSIGGRGSSFVITIPKRKEADLNDEGDDRGR